MTDMIRERQVQRAVPHKHNQKRHSSYLKRDPYLLRSPSFSLALAFLLGSVVDKGVSLAKYAKTLKGLSQLHKTLTQDMRLIYTTCRKR